MRHIERAAIAACFWLPSLFAAPVYSWVDIGSVTGRALNNLGQVAGSTGSQAFLYSGGVITVLGDFGGGLSSGAGINNNGQVTGFATNSDGVAKAFIYSAGVMTGLGTLGTGQASSGLDINDAGQIVGAAEPSVGALAIPFLYSAGVMGNLGLSDGSAEAINNSGQIAGRAQLVPVSEPHGYLYSGGTITDLGFDALPRDVNNLGQVVGSLDLFGPEFHAFLYSGGTRTDLGAPAGLSSNAAAINDSGDIVGTLVFDFANTWAMFYSGGVMYDLNDLVPNLDTTLRAAVDINSSGQILALGRDNHTYLLTPGAGPIPEPAGVPEPASFVFAGAGIAALILGAKRKRRS
jgi:probable HAF family extracellular repeat protein